MSISHLAAIVRMRWQSLRNQFRRSGKANWIITMILLALAALGSFSSFIIAAGWGTFFLGMMEPFYVIYVWDVLALLFLFGWAMALLVELQRSEMLSLRNLLHLPISLSGAFFLNYTSSLASLTLLLFLPAALGVCVASVVHFGIRSLVVFPLLAAFLFMVTAVSYQLRGWLARLMENKRTRGTVIAITTIVFVVIFQIPTILNLGNATSFVSGSRARVDDYLERMEELKQQRDSGQLDPAEWAAATEAAHVEYERQRTADEDGRVAHFNRTASFVNAVLPIGWLAYGASAAALGKMASPWLCVLGMSTIGAGSLTLAYRSTLRAYTGEHNKTYHPVARKSHKVRRKESLLEWKIPLLNDAQSAVTLATLRSMLRAPEAKMALLSPLILACIFGSMMFTRRTGDMPDAARPWLGLGALAMSLFGMVQMMVNIFGLDRQAFRAYVLMPVPRRDILLGKNLGIVPIAGTLCALLIVFAGVMVQMQVTHIVATLLQTIVVFCIYFPIGNNSSIIAPIGMAVGTMRPVSMKFTVFAMQFVSMMVIPVAILPAAFSLGIELIVSELIGIRGIPIYLLLTLIEVPLAIWLYLRVLDVQGRFLQKREQAILDVISKVAD